jgi:ABC-type nitrate/sulfonate/bicarbonate transport system substrate-binding protein
MVAERPDAVAAFVEGAAKGLRDTYLDIPAAVATVQRMAPEANVDTEVATRQLELIRDLVLTDNSRTNGIGSFQEEQLTATKTIMMRYLGMKTDLALTDVSSMQFTPATPVMP